MHLRRFLWKLGSGFALLLAVDSVADDFGPRALILGQHVQFVSLGALCEPAVILKQSGLRIASFPFDWVFTFDIDGLSKCFEEDFLFFTDERWFKEPNSEKITQTNHHYHMYFFHDLNAKEEAGGPPEMFPDFKAKYDRRVARFRDLRNFQGKVYFLRTWWNSSTQGLAGEFNQNTVLSRKLKAVLDEYFPSLDFVLIICSYVDLNIPKTEEIEGVVEFQMERSSSAFQERMDEYLLRVEE